MTMQKMFLIFPFIAVDKVDTIMGTMGVFLNDRIYMPGCSIEDMSKTCDIALSKFAFLKRVFDPPLHSLH